MTWKAVAEFERLRRGRMSGRIPASTEEAIAAAPLTRLTAELRRREFPRDLGRNRRVCELGYTAFPSETTLVRAFWHRASYALRTK